MNGSTGWAHGMCAGLVAFISKLVPDFLPRNSAQEPVSYLGLPKKWPHTNRTVQEVREEFPGCQVDFSKCKKGLEKDQFRSKPYFFPDLIFSSLSRVSFLDFFR